MLICDVGAGHHPLQQATHLVDKYPDSNIERRGQNLIIGNRQFTQADIQDLPFDDNSFHFVNASHVVEHTDNPYKALSEIMRIGKSGYVECPPLIAENLLFGSPNHKVVLISFLGNACFLASTRKAYRQIPNFLWKTLRALDPFFNLCHTRYYWGTGKALRLRFDLSNTKNPAKKAHILFTFTFGDLTQNVLNMIAYAFRKQEVKHLKSLQANNVMNETGGRD